MPARQADGAYSASASPGVAMLRAVFSVAPTYTSRMGLSRLYDDDNWLEACN